MIDLDPATLPLQLAVGGLGFGWATSRNRDVGVGYGVLVRSVFGVLALGAGIVGLVFEPEPVRDLAALAAGMLAVAALAWTGWSRRTGGAGPAPWIDLGAATVGAVGLVAAAAVVDHQPVLAGARLFAGAALLGAVTDAMLLGHWYLVQPGLSRERLVDLVRWVQVAWAVEVVVYLWPVGMVSALSGAIDDGQGGLLGWFWVASASATVGLATATRAALREPGYAAVMAATGLLYLAMLTGFGTDLVARAVLAS